MYIIHEHFPHLVGCIGNICAISHITIQVMLLVPCLIILLLVTTAIYVSLQNTVGKEK